MKNNLILLRFLFLSGVVEFKHTIDDSKESWCMGDDVNMTGFPSERLSGGSITHQMWLFLDWTRHYNHLDIHMANATNTWSNN